MKYIFTMVVFFCSLSAISQTRKDQLISDCKVFSKTTQASYSYEFNESSFSKELIALCHNDVLAYYGKSKMDDLDKALYKKSEEYKTDLNNFNKRKNEKMAIIYPFESLSEPKWDFSANGFSFRAKETRSFEQKNCLRFMDLIIPINPNLAKSNDDWHFFKCSNLVKLQEIRANKDKIELLLIFKSGMAAVNGIWSAEVKDYVYLLNPVSLYLLNKSTGEVVLDLSNCLRKSGIATDKQRIEATAKAKQKKNKSTKSTEPLYRRTCTFCNGTGRRNGFACGSCNGKGYENVYF